MVKKGTQSFTDFTEGVGDGFTLSARRKLLGDMPDVDYDSLDYEFGTWVGSVASIGYAIDSAFGKTANSCKNKTGNPVVTGSTYSKYAKQATNNPNSSKVILGKYNQDGRSYVDVAKDRKATYFQLDNWNEVQNKIGEKNMWKINEEFLNQQLKAGKDIYFSHDPWKATGYYQEEVLYLINKGAKDFVPVGENLWKMIK